MSYEDENPEAYARDRHIEELHECIAEMRCALRTIISIADQTNCSQGDQLRVIIEQCHKGLKASEGR